MYYYEVAPLKIVRQESNVFTYNAEKKMKIGSLVTVPIGKVSQTGLIIRSVKKPPYDTRSISSVLDYAPIPQPLVDTIAWLGEYYSTHLATVLQTALPAGLTKTRRPLKNATIRPVRHRIHFLLNKAQSTAVSSVMEASQGTFILHGVTASGKTAVYIELARKMLETNKSVVILVPEIALTSQLVAEFYLHFKDIILTHSHQTEAQRHSAWSTALNADRPVIAIGPRSALFLPLSSIGLIVIDEAHEPSYKQDKSPRYSALRVASILARHHDGKVVQGSATPLISEYYLASQAKRPIITLTEKARHDAVDPTVTVIDMTKKTGFRAHRFISDKLISAIKDSLENKEQCLLYHNRRGSASTTLCEQCGWSAMCERCFIPLTLHADIHRLECHICAARMNVPTSCPKCASTDIIHKGIGTKLLESEARRLFPHARIARFDGDADSNATLEKRYQELYDGDIDIIIGTQVVAKGLDLPHLRTVGVVQADAGLSLPDYQSSERTFQLLSQVVGRVGRSSHPTSVIIQTYQPHHPAVQYGVSQDFSAFYTYAIAERQRALFPPFTYLLKLTCIYKTEAATIRNVQEKAAMLRQEHPDIRIFGPTPAFYERQRDTYRWQLVLKSSDRSKLLSVMKKTTGPHWQADIDPASLL